MGDAPLIQVLYLGLPKLYCSQIPAHQKGVVENPIALIVRRVDLQIALELYLNWSIVLWRTGLHKVVREALAFGHVNT